MNDTVKDFEFNDATCTFSPSMTLTADFPGTNCIPIGKGFKFSTTNVSNTGVLTAI